MKTPINKFAFAAITATALSLPLAGTAFADTSSAMQPTMLAANDTMDQAGEVVTDTWITSKVKSTFLADDSLSALDIKVETNKGVVSLSGVVASDAERDLAVAKTKEINGVKDVSADGLKTAD
ncbi:MULTISPECIES: BON domain-containing protein [Pseudomonas]|uniref:Osmotically-inducible protein Y n=1 Tax=Pseudomonas segetis TaxID=298908 RepID=A0A239GNF2_9PSED|nr:MULTISPECIES: BON domain-containing protein [Pseudomonas]SNS70660.1 hyperosmotically inducible protein [Pseudomonas segetis]